jgi:hypothetical protein
MVLGEIMPFVGLVHRVSSTPDNLGNSMFGFNDGGGQGSGGIAGNTDANIVINACSTDAATGYATNVDGSGKVAVTVNDFNIASNNLNNSGYGPTSISCTSSSPTPTGPEPASDQVINVNITYNGLDAPTVSGGGNDTLGPVTVSLCSATKTSDITCTDPTQTIQSNVTTISSSTTVLNASFTGVAPGDYVICTTNLATNSCVNKTKTKDQILTVNFTGTAADAASIIGAAQSGVQGPSCESSGFSLSWIMCPLIDGMATAVDGIYKDLVQPLLKTPAVEISQPADCLNLPPNTTPPSGCDPAKTYQVWSDFRTYGNIFLVIALLGLVFGEIIGGGIIQAYTAKKMLPRILLAVILINLSLYLVAALLDITNVIGAGLSNLITAPFSSSGAFYIHLTGAASGLGLATFVGAGALGIWAVVGLAPVLIIMFLLFVLLPALFAMLAVLFTVVIRQGIIVFLVISSPVAFALYVLPNTEQYFKKWWHLLFTTLLVYPIIAVLFSLGNVLSVTLSDSSYRQNGVTATVSGLVAMVAIIMPLFLVPFAFKMAGGIMGSIYGGLSSLGKKAVSGIQGDPRNPNSLQNNLRRRFNNIGTKRGNKLDDYLRKKTTSGDGAYKDNWLGRRKRGVATQALKRLPNYQRKHSAINRLESEAILTDLNSGADTWAMAAFDQEGNGAVYKNAAGEDRVLQKGHFYSHAKDSKGEYTEHAPGDVMKARGFMKGNPSRFQSILQYNIGKVANTGELYGVDANGEEIHNPARMNENVLPGGSLLGNSLKVARDSNLTTGGAGGAFVGAFFNSQKERVELKATRMNPDFSGFTRDGGAFVQNVGENIGLYATSTSKPSVVYALLDEYKNLEQKRKDVGVEHEDGSVGPELTTVEKRSYKTLQGVARSYSETLRQSPSDSIPSAASVREVSEDGTPQAQGSGTGAAVNVNNAMRAFVKFNSDIGRVDMGDDPGSGTTPPEPPSPAPRGSGPARGPRRPSGSGSSGESSGEMLINHDDGSPASTPSIPGPVRISSEPPSTASVRPSTSSIRSGSPRQNNEPKNEPRVGFSPDIIDIDKSGKPRREDGKIMSKEHAEIAQSNEDLIRGGLAERAKTPRADNPQYVVPSPNIDHEGVSHVELSPDIMDLDKNGNPHREDGAFMSNSEAEIAQSNEDLIRGGLAERAENDKDEGNKT